MTRIPDVTPNNGHTSPQLGFGVFQVPRHTTAEAITRFSALNPDQPIGSNADALG